MLQIIVPSNDDYDEANQRFIVRPSVTLKFEHSLVSLSKWESSWEKPFLSEISKTDEEATDYIRCMCLSPDVPAEIFNRLSQENLDEINRYINAKMTATWFSSVDTKKATEIVTSEVLYYWMFSMSIPIECENWHLARLMTLIKVYNEKSGTKKKMSPAEIAAQNRKLNAERKARLGTSG